MQFHNYIINLLEEPITTKLDNPQLIDLFSQTLGQKPRELLSSSKRSFETIIRLYYLRHGFEALDCFMVQYLSMLAFMAYGALQASTQKTTVQALQSTIVLATMGLRDQSASFYTGRMVFKAVRGGMRCTRWKHALMFPCLFSYTSRCTRLPPVYIQSRIIAAYKENSQ